MCILSRKSCPFIRTKSARVIGLPESAERPEQGTSHLCASQTRKQELERAFCNIFFSEELQIQNFATRIIRFVSETCFKDVAQLKSNQTDLGHLGGSVS